MNQEDKVIETGQEDLLMVHKFMYPDAEILTDVNSLPYAARKGNSCLNWTELRYNKDWNQLMKVVEKINSIKPYNVIIWSRDCHINDDREIIFENSYNSSLINAVYLSVVQFITWYNQNKQL